MIIILNGMYGTHIENLSKIISYELNKNSDFSCSYEIDGNNSFNITNDSSNKIIHEETDIIIEGSSEDELNQIKNNSIKLDNIMLNEELKDYFVKCAMYDYGIEKVPDFFINEVPNYVFNDIDYSPKEIVKRYKNSSLKYYLICGQLCKYMIDEIINIAGQEEVKVYNIIRNPTVSNFIFDSIYNEVKDNLMCSSVYNSLYFMQNNITTFKYEDICEKLSINIENIDIPLPSNFKLKFNKISEFEHNSPFLIDYFNKKIYNFENKHKLFSNIDMINSWYYGLTDDERVEEATKLFNDANSKNLHLRNVNVFELLNYEKINEKNFF